MIEPAPPTERDIRDATERRQRELAEQAERDARAEQDRRARATTIAAAETARAARLAALASEELAANDEAWESLPEHRKRVVFPRDFAADLEHEELLHLASWTIAHIQDPVVQAAIQRFVDHGHRHKPHLILRGNTGVGKTTAAIAAGHALIRDHGLHVRLVSQKKYLAEIMPDGTPRQGMTQDRFKRRMRRAEVLIISDLGKGLTVGQPASRFVQDELTDLIEARADRITIVETNLRAKQLATMFDDRFMSRLAGDAVAIPMVGRDLRQPIDF